MTVLTLLSDKTFLLNACPALESGSDGHQPSLLASISCERPEAAHPSVEEVEKEVAFYHVSPVFPALLNRQKGNAHSSLPDMASSYISLQSTDIVVY